MTAMKPTVPLAHTPPHMVLIKIMLVAAFVAGLLATAQSQQWFERAGLLSRCKMVAAPRASKAAGGQWWSCTEGAISGFPNLTRDHCDTKGVYGHQQLWYCPLGREN
jgi:hypothetical protein